MSLIHEVSHAKLLKFPKILEITEQPCIPILDTGHGGIVNGRYVTPGKRYDKSQPVIYEGVFNRIIADRIELIFNSMGVAYERIFVTEEDTPLEDRIKETNKIYREIKRVDKESTCCLISLHGNAHVDERARGVEVYTSPGSTHSDLFADNILFAALNTLPSSMRFRHDFSDGDADKEARFLVLTRTECPAVLTEFGFMTNKHDRQFMLNGDGQMLIAASIAFGFIQACVDLYGWEFDLDSEEETIEDLFPNPVDNTAGDLFYWSKFINKEDEKEKVKEDDTRPSKDTNTNKNGSGTEELGLQLPSL